MRDHAGHRAEALGRAEGVDLHAQAHAAAAGDAAQADVLRPDLDAGAIGHRVEIAAVIAERVEIDPLIADLAIDHAAFAGPQAEAAGGAIFPIDIALEALGDIALGTDEHRPERNVDAGDALDEPAVIALAVCGQRDAGVGLLVEALIAAEDADIGLDAERLGAVRRGFGGGGGAGGGVGVLGVRGGDGEGQRGKRRGGEKGTHFGEIPRDYSNTRPAGAAQDTRALAAGHESECTGSREVAAQHGIGQGCCAGDTVPRCQISP